LAENGGAPVGDLAESLPRLTPGETLEDAVALLVRSSVEGLAVVDPERQVVVGWLTHHDVLRTYHDGQRRNQVQARPLGSGRS
jgi:CBS domain-containing protein